MHAPLLLISLLTTMPVASPIQKFGVPRIVRFSEGAKSAVSLQFDDSMTTQLANAIPLLNERHLRATFFINPGRPQHQAHLHEWEFSVPMAKHELANHTLNHIGAKDAAEAEREIGACSAVLRKIYGDKPRLMSFGQPGGVPWAVTPAQLAPIFAKYRLIPSVNRVFFDEKTTDPVSIVQRSLDRKEWLQLGMHGTGGEWLSTSIPTLTKLFDFLVAHRPEVWVAPTIEVYKYVHERDAAKTPVLKPSGSGFSISVDCDPAKLETFGLPVQALYDQPLTVEVPVPADWQKVRVRQGRMTYVYETKGGSVLLNVLPNVGAAKVDKLN